MTIQSYYLSWGPFPRWVLIPHEVHRAEAFHTQWFFRGLFRKEGTGQPVGWNLDTQEWVFRYLKGEWEKENGMKWERLERSNLFLLRLILFPFSHYWGVFSKLLFWKKIYLSQRLEINQCLKYDKGKREGKRDWKNEKKTENKVKEQIQNPRLSSSSFPRDFPSKSCKFITPSNPWVQINTLSAPYHVHFVSVPFSKKHIFLDWK